MLNDGNEIIPDYRITGYEFRPGNRAVQDRPALAVFFRKLN